MRVHTFKLYVEHENVNVLLFTCYKENDAQTTQSEVAMNYVDESRNNSSPAVRDRACILVEDVLGCLRSSLLCSCADIGLAMNLSLSPRSLIKLVKCPRTDSELSRPEIDVEKRLRSVLKVCDDIPLRNCFLSKINNDNHDNFC
jgi:hypothetical protein